VSPISRAEAVVGAGRKEVRPRPRSLSEVPPQAPALWSLKPHSIVCPLLIIPHLLIILPFSFLIYQYVPLILNQASKSLEHPSKERRQSVRRGYISPLMRHKASSRRLLLRHILSLLKLCVSTLVTLLTLVILILFEPHHIRP